MVNESQIQQAPQAPYPFTCLVIGRPLVMANHVTQMDRDTVLVCFERKSSLPLTQFSSFPLHHPADTPGILSCRLINIVVLALGCVRVVNLRGAPRGGLAPELTFNFPIETIGMLGWWGLQGGKAEVPCGTGDDGAGGVLQASS